MSHSSYHYLGRNENSAAMSEVYRFRPWWNSISYPIGITRNPDRFCPGSAREERKLPRRRPLLQGFACMVEEMLAARCIIASHDDGAAVGAYVRPGIR